MAWSRRTLLVTAAGTAPLLAGCGGPGLSGPATPPPAEFHITAVGDHAAELRYTGIGSQDPARFRVVLSGGGAADGTYSLDTITDDTGWSAEDRYVLNQTTLGLAAPLAVAGLTVALEYNDDGDWKTLVRTHPAD